MQRVDDLIDRKKMTKQIVCVFFVSGVVLAGAMVLYSMMLF